MAIFGDKSQKVQNLLPSPADLASELHSIDWDEYINDNRPIDKIADSIINNIECKVKITLRKKSNFKDKKEV